MPLMDSRQDDAMELDTGDDMPHNEPMLSIADPTKKMSMEDDPHMSAKLKALVSNPPPSFNIPPPLIPVPSLLGKPPLLPGQNFSMTSLPPPSLNASMSDQSLQNNEKDKDIKRDRDGSRKERRDRDRGDRDRPRDR